MHSCIWYGRVHCTGVYTAVPGYVYRYTQATMLGCTQRLVFSEYIRIFNNLLLNLVLNFMLNLVPCTSTGSTHTLENSFECRRIHASSAHAGAHWKDCFKLGSSQIQNFNFYYEITILFRTFFKIFLKKKSILIWIPGYSSTTRVVSKLNFLIFSPNLCEIDQI